MARGIARAPSQNAYRGTIGRTRTETVHVTGPRGDLIVATIYTTVDAVSDPELVDRLHSADPARALNVVRVDGGEPIQLSTPVVYHDPAAELLVLVLADAHRHRELDERIRLLERLRADDAPVPAYAKDFAVVFGASGLRAYLEQRANEALASARASEAGRDSDRRRGELAAREAELERTRKELDGVRGELERTRSELDVARGELERAAPGRAGGDDGLTAIGAPPSAPEEQLRTKPVPRSEAEDIETDVGQRALPPRTSNGAAPRPLTAAPAAAAAAAVQVEFDEDEPTAHAIIPSGADPLTTETTELPAGQADPWLEFAATGATSSFQVDHDDVRLALVVGDQIARGLGGQLDVRVLLHRLPTYPIVTLVFGPPAALRVPSPTQLAVIALDIGVDLDRQVLVALAKNFALAVDIVTRGRVMRRVQLAAPLADNVAYVLRAADDHLRDLTADGDTEPSFARARDLVLGAGYDLLGLQHPETTEFRDDKLAQLQTAQQLRRALAIARRFARPSREDYLVCARGFPLARWHELRRHVLESAVAWGIWMGPELAQVAVSEGLARSRRDLIVKLDAGFEVLRRHPTAFDLDADAADDNAKAIAEEAKALGVEARRAKNGAAIKSEDVPIVSGSIERTPTGGVAVARSVDELIALLDDKQQRVTAALELCERADPRAAAPVIAAVRKLSRAEAVRVLGKSVRFGAAAAPPLIEGLRSSKAFLRHGCALALALLRTEDGTQAVVDLLLDEPTEIWRELARAIGQIGATALMPLASRAGKLGDRIPPAIQERIAWAAAHVGVRGGQPALAQMASGQSVMAPIARQALDLLSNAARDEVRLRDTPGKDVTVNRAFSRRFFEALEAERPDDARAALGELDASVPVETLDEADLIVDDEEESELDESDLIHT